MKHRVDGRFPVGNGKEFVNPVLELSQITTKI